MPEERSSTTVHERLAAARARIARFTPAEAWDAMRDGALLVDLRDADRRRRDGVVPGSVHIPLLVLEWRMCPQSAYTHPLVTGHDQMVILLCNEGYGSSLAAASLTELGFAAAGDVIGGFGAWLEAGLPSQPPQEPPAGLLDGMGPSEPGGP